MARALVYPSFGPAFALRIVSWPVFQPATKSPMSTYTPPQSRFQSSHTTASLRTPPPVPTFAAWRMLKEVADHHQQKRQVCSMPRMRTRMAVVSTSSSKLLAMRTMKQKLLASSSPRWHRMLLACPDPTLLLDDPSLVRAEGCANGYVRVSDRDGGRDDGDGGCGDDHSSGRSDYRSPV